MMTRCIALVLATLVSMSAMIGITDAAQNYYNQARHVSCRTA